MDYQQKQEEIRRYLTENEKSPSTIEKYLGDVCQFCFYIEEQMLVKSVVIDYKNSLKKKYAPSSVNSKLIAVNQFLRFIGQGDCQVKLLRIQKQIFMREDRELTNGEYMRLLQAAEGKRIGYVIQTICCTGIRVSELQYITAEAVSKGKAIINCKNKTRIIFIPRQLCKVLQKYMEENDIKAGPVFVTKNGNALNRSNIWRDMKALCQKAGLDKEKVYPHNLRHLFARTFYSVDQDIVQLADLLGHSNINTTRIYTKGTGRQHVERLEKVQKLLTTELPLCSQSHIYLPAS